MTKAQQSELLDLLWLLHEQRLPADAAARLDAWLAGDEQARAIQSRFFVMCGLLHWRASERPEIAAPAEPTAAPVELPRKRLWTVVRDFANDYMTLSVVVATLTITIILLSLALIVPDWGRSTPNVAEVDPPSTEFVARIARTSQADFDKSSDGNFQNRDMFDDDKIVLNSGLAVIEYDTGARVVLEGPATYHINGANGGDLRLGRLVANVPKRATGFVVATPFATVTDLGTEFGMIVEESGATETYVLQGDVVVETAIGRSTSLRLTTGEASNFSVDDNRLVRLHDTETGRLNRAISFGRNERPEPPKGSIQLLVNFRPPGNTSIRPQGWNHVSVLEGDVGPLLQSNGQPSDIRLTIVDGFGWVYPSALNVNEPHRSSSGAVFPTEVLRSLAGDNYASADRNGIASMALTSPRAFELAITLAIAADERQDRTICNIGGTWSKEQLEFAGGHSVELWPDADGDSATLQGTSTWDQATDEFVLMLHVANGVKGGGGAAGVSALHIVATPIEEPVEVKQQ